MSYNQHGGTPKILNLNKSNYIDTMKLNDVNIYLNKNGLYVMKLMNDHLMWRGYNNVRCLNLLIPPGSKNDWFKYEPVWYGPPEVTVIYAVRDVLNVFLRSYKNFVNIDENTNLDDALSKYSHILTNNYSSIVAYTIKNPCELLDINNIENLKRLIELFDENWSIDAFNMLNNLNRITTRQKLRIYLWIETFQKGNNEKTDDNMKNIQYADTKEKEQKLNEYFKDIKDNKIIGYIQKVMIYCFRKVFGFGKYLQYNSRKRILEERKMGRLFIARVKKDLRKEPEGTLQNLTDISLLRESSNKIFSGDDFTKYDTISYPIIKQKFSDRKVLFDTIINLVDSQIKKYVVDESKIFIDNTSITNKLITDKFKTNNSKSSKIIQQIEKGSISGYIIDLDRNSKIGLEKKVDIKGNEYYSVHIYYDENIKGTFTNNSESQVKFDDDSICKLCNLAHKRNWLKEKASNTMTHREGLVKNQMYYDYNPFNKKVEKVGICFENLFGKSDYSLSEERVLAIPYSHLGTMFSHSDCKIASKNFPPRGLYEKNKYACGAYLYANSPNNSETLYHFMATYNSALTYAYKKYGVKCRIADINYDKYNGKFYKFKNPIRYGTNDPQMYINFHCKVNSEPHIHMHTYIDAMGTNLFDTLETGRFSKNRKMSRIALAASELFGVASYAKFYGTRKSTIRMGNRLKTEYDAVKIVEPSTWFDKDRKESSEKMQYPCSFQYLVKKVIGIDDNDPIMKHKWVFSEPNYEEQPTLFNQKMFSYAGAYNDMSKQIYAEELKLSQDVMNKNPNLFKKSPDLPEKVIKNTEKIGDIHVKYCETKKELCMVRQSTTEADAIMVLFLQIACLKNPNIGGYFGSSSPLMNYRRNITHTETCLFNVVDYPVNIVRNAPFSTCNNDDKEKTINMINIAIFMLYSMYFKQSQRKFILNGFNIKRINLINQFLYSDTGYKIDTSGIIGEEEYLEEEEEDEYGEEVEEEDYFRENYELYGGITKEEGAIISQALSSLEKRELARDITKEKLINDLKDLVDINNLDNLISEFNSKTKKYKLKENDIILAKNTLKSIYYNQVPTNQQNEWFA
uniref:Uncharacterized protein n=1 Tax=Mimivirus LCMiAC01 TaxID=2506608 RepID=A0A481Z182_9VIRU|nr:MAG: hypothetical protein LCMiAC01_05290 [Mimivirus LCMiAC01]